MDEELPPIPQSPVDGTPTDLTESSTERPPSFFNEFVSTENEEPTLNNAITESTNEIPSLHGTSVFIEVTPEEGPADERPADERLPDERPADEGPADQPLPDVRPPDEGPADQRLPDVRPADEEPADQQLPNERPPDEGPADQRLPDERPPCYFEIIYNRRPALVCENGTSYRMIVVVRGYVQRHYEDPPTEQVPTEPNAGDDQENGGDSSIVSATCLPLIAQKYNRNLKIRNKLPIS